MVTRLLDIRGLLDWGVFQAMIALVLDLDEVGADGAVGAGPGMVARTATPRMMAQRSDRHESSFDDAMRLTLPSRQRIDIGEDSLDSGRRTPIY